MTQKYSHQLKNKRHSNLHSCMMFLNKKNTQRIAMSIIKSTTAPNKFKPFSLGNFTYRSGHFVVWPKKKSYNAWQNLLKTTLSNLKRKDISYPCRKQKKKNKYSHRYRKFLHA